ncbi:lipopolysaccharide biosynthesis protein [Gemmatimonadota bacterium]
MTASVQQRFVFTLGSNVFRGLLSFTTGMLLARWLGPEAYGMMAFLLGTFLGVRQLTNMGTSAAFFTFLSQQPRSKAFVRAFFSWLALQFILPAAAIGLLFPVRWIEAIWDGQPRSLVLLAFAAVFMQNSLWPVVQQAAEAQRRTLWVQSIGVLVGAAHLAAVVLLWSLGVLGLYAIFIAVAIEFFLAAFVAHSRLSYATSQRDSPEAGPAAALRMYIHYCLPLVPYSVFGFAYQFADRWLLQSFGGGVEQAYYSVGAQFSRVALIATTAILRIFWKEIAEASHEGDYARMGRLYRKVTRLLFFVGAGIVGFLMPWATDLLDLMLGAEYVGGATTLMIMFLYPVHQSIGQINGTLLMATERVKVHVLVGTAFMACSIAVTYLVLAPPDALVPGLGLASQGLALKMVMMQFIQVNIVMYIIARIWHWSFDWLFQPIALFGCIGLGWVVHEVGLRLIAVDLTLPLKMGLVGIVYLCLLVGFLYAVPWVAGFTREELMTSARTIWPGSKH